MALKVEKGVITSPGATGNQTINLIDTGFGTVKALIVWGSYHTAEGDTDGNAIFCQGIGTYRGSVVQQTVVSFFSADAGASSDTARGHQTNQILRGYSAAAPTVDFTASLVSLGDAQFVLNWTDLPATASIKFHYLVLGGSEITDALVDSFSSPTVTGTLNETVATGFGKPDLLFSLFGANFPNADSASDIEFAFGVGKDDANEASTSIAENDGEAVMDMNMAQKSSWLAAVKAAGMQVEMELTAKSNWPTDGFQVNVVTAPGFALVVSYLALRGTFTSVIGSGTAPTAAPTVTQDLPVGATPRGAIFFHNSLPAVATTDNTSADLGTIGIGAMDGTREGWAGFGQDDGAGDSQTHRHHSESKVIRMFTPGAAGTLQSEADASFSGNNVRLTWPDTDTVAREYRYVLLGDSTSITYEKTGALVAGTRTVGADVAERAEAGAITAGALLPGSDVIERNRAGSLVATGRLVGADAFESSEAGSLVAATLLVGADVSERTEAGALVTTARLSAADVAERAETGSLVTQGLLSGIGSKDGAKAGSLVTTGRLSGVDVAESSETGSLVTAGRISGADAWERAMAGALVAQAMLRGVDQPEYAEAGALMASARLSGLDSAQYAELGSLIARGLLSGIGIKEGAGKSGSLVAGTRLVGSDAWERAKAGAIVATFRVSGVDVAEHAELGSLVAGTWASGSDVAEYTESGSLVAGTRLGGSQSHEISKIGSLIARAIVAASVLEIVVGQLQEFISGGRAKSGSSGHVGSGSPGRASSPSAGRAKRRFP